jgi:PIN domain nuclease of toxin-antitoxin system
LGAAISCRCAGSASGPPRNGCAELAIGGEHAVAIANLPPIHKDPFDRMLVAESAIEGILLLTADPAVAQYPGPVRNV